MNERKLIDLLQPFLDPHHLDGEDDAVAITVENQFLVINTDSWVASTDRPPGVRLDGCGYRAVANAVSDVVAKQAEPEGMVVSMSFPEMTHASIISLIRGLKEASRDFNVKYYGGDLNSSTDLVITVTAWGSTNKVCPRSGAKPGESLYWLGPPLGSTAAAFGILMNEWKGDMVKAQNIYSRPELPMGFLNINASAAIDCSDGVARSLYLLKKASQVGFLLVDKLRIDDWVKEVSLINNQSLLDLIYHGGEELGVLFTCHPQTEIPRESIYLGTVTKDQRITVAGEELVDQGWDHFSS